MSDPIYGPYDQETLDAAYDARAMSSDVDGYKAAQANASERVRESLPASLNVSYGPGPADSVDIFTAQGDGPHPVLVFFHGGYWKRNHKEEFSFIAGPLAAAGAVTIVVEYPLIPTVKLDGLVESCRAATAWAWRNADRFDGDPERIHVCGHSAGGHLTAMMMATDWPAYGEDLPADLVKSGFATSGLYDLEPVRLSSQNDDLNLTDGDVIRNSPMYLQPMSPGPLTLQVGQLEGPEFIRQSVDMAAIWREAGIETQTRVLDGQHHFSICSQLIKPDSELSRALKAQIGLG